MRDACFYGGPRKRKDSEKYHHMDSPLPAAVLLLLLMTLMNIMLYGFGAALQNLNQTELEEKAQNGDERRHSF